VANPTLANLKLLQKIVIYANSEVLKAFPLKEMIEVVIQIFNATKSPEVQEKCCCIIDGFLHMTTQSTSVLMRLNVLDCFLVTLQPNSPEELLESSIQAVCHLATFRGAEVAAKMRMRPFLDVFEKVRGYYQKLILRRLNQVEFWGIPEFAPDLPKLFELTISSRIEGKIKEMVRSLLEAYLNYMTVLVFPQELLDSFLQLIKQSKNQSDLEFAFLSLKRLAAIPQHCQSIIDANLDFKELLNNTLDIQTRVLDFIRSLLPVTENLKHIIPSLSEAKRPDATSSRFAITIQPFLLSILSTPSLPLIEYVLLALIATLEDSVFQMTTEIFVVLQRLAVSPTNLHVLVIFSYYSTCPLLRGSDILMRVTLKRDDEWYKNLYSRLADSVGTFQSVYTSAEAVFDALNNHELCVLNLINPERLSEIISLIENEEDLNERANYFEQLVEHLPSAFPWLEVPQIVPRMTADEWVKYINKSCTINVALPDGQELVIQMKQTLPLHFLMMDCQSFVRNESELFHDLPDFIRKIVCNSPPPSHDEVRLIAWLWDVKRSTTTTFEPYPGMPLSLCDCLFTILRNLQRDSLQFTIVPCQKDCGISSPVPGKMPMDHTLFDLFKKVYDITGKPLVNQKFVDKIVAQLVHPFEILNSDTSVLSWILRYPFLFPHEIRLFAAKLHALDVASSTALLFRHFEIPISVAPIQHLPLRFTVAKESIYRQGTTLLSIFGRSFIPIEVSVTANKNSTSGSTSDFFRLISREFTKREMKVFDSVGKSTEYCEDPRGLFPSPDASPHSFFSFGILCAKAIQMHQVLDLDLNPTFILLLRGMEIRIQSVNPLWTGCVSERNHFAAIRETFLDGFNLVLPFKAFDFLDPYEFCALLSGDSMPWTEDDIRAHITFKGFRSCPLTAGWFISIVSQMSPALQSNLLRFITGMGHLPNGGLKTLKPQITVIRLSPMDHDNSDLPIAITTTHQLKIPECDSRDDLLNKLMVVISEH
jgi:hypothetical protein